MKPLSLHFFTHHLSLITHHLSLITHHFLSKVRIDLDEGRDGKGYGAEEHDQYEEGVVAQLVFEPTRQHAWGHEAEVGESRTEGIVGGLELAL